LPHVKRSNSPHAFAAAGKRAAQITAPHAVDVPHGLDSPIGRAYELDGQVLLLGVGQGSNTTIRLAEYLAGVRYRREKYVVVLSHDKPSRFEYREIDHCCQNFDFVDQWLDERGLQCNGKIGHVEARLARCRDIVEVAVEHLKADKTVFLHPKGVDEECDDVRKSLSMVK
jgi:aminoglycoside N3'-acetyltransferase